MASFPTLVTADSKTGSGNSTSYTANYPDNLNPGDLILLLHGNRGRQSITPPGDSGWVNLQRAQGGGGLSGAQSTAMWSKKVSDGTESGTTFSVSWSGAGGGYVWHTLRITNWEGTLGTTFDNTANSGSVELNYAEGNSSTPDPPDLNPNNWGTENTLWLANVVGREFLGTFSGYPLGSYQAGTTLSDFVHYRCGTESAVANLDPSTFTFSGGDDWITGTLAIRFGQGHDRVSQDPLEVLAQPSDLMGRVSQEPLEALISPETRARVSQDPVEALVFAINYARVSQDPVEVLVELISDAGFQVYIID